jgi:hypothetical protein
MELANGRPRGTRTTGELLFPECLELPREPKIGHSGKAIFPECCTRGRIALGEDGLPRVPKRPWHSGKTGTRGRPSSPSATLGEDGTRKRKGAFDGGTERNRLKKNWKPSSPSARSQHSGKATSSPSALSPALGEEPLPRVPCHWHSGKYFCFFVFFAPIFLWGLLTLFKTPCPN